MKQWTREAAIGTMVVALLLTPAAALSAQQAGGFTVDHAIDMARVDDPRISPDGARVLFTRSTLDWEDNERDRRLWIAGADGSDARPFTSGEGDGSPRWSPDGRRVAFLRPSGEEADRKDQIFLIRTDGGEALQLTRHATSIEEFEWTADGERIVFLAPDSLTDQEEEAREKGADALFVNEGPNGQLRDRYSNLWWVDAMADSAEARPITEGERLIGDFAVSPDGERVAFTFRTENLPNDRFRTEIAVVDIGTGAVRQLTRNEVPESAVAWSPDGRTLTFMARDLETWTLAQDDLYAMDPASGEVRLLFGDDETQDLRDYAWAPDGRRIHLEALDRTVSHIYELDVRSGRVSPVTAFEGILSSASYSREHDVAAYTFQTPTSPAEVYTTRLDAVRPVQVTAVHDGIRDLDLADAEVVQWRSSDGLQIEGLLYQPPGVRSSGAMVLEIHGGPAGVFSRGFDADAQILAANGYAVLQPNVRGSSGYGDEFIRGNMNDIGGRDYEDLMTGVDAMLDRGVGHPDSLAVKGWSYGGILGGMTIVRTDRFKAASLGAMVADWPGEFGVGHNYDVVRWYLGSDLWSNREHWIERSAYWRADEIETPTILFHGERDRTDTPGQSMNFHMALLHFGVPSRYILFPREPHGIREPRHHRTRLVEELRWFQQWVRGDEDWEAPERPAVDRAVAEEDVAAAGRP